MVPRVPALFSLSLSLSLSLSDRFCPPELDLCKSNINRKAVFHSETCSRGDKIVARQSKGGGEVSVALN